MNNFPKKCPLTIPDWLNYLTSLRDSFHSGVLQFESAKHNGIALSIAWLSLFVSMWISFGILLDLSYLQILLIIVIIFVFVMIFMYKLTDYNAGMEKYNAECRDDIQDIINKIMTGDLNESNLVRQYYNKKAIEISSRGKRLITELQLDEE